MNAEIPQAPPVLDGDRVYRIHWVLGTDRLRAVCHCGAERDFEGPVELWEWLLAHPDDHSTDHPDDHRSSPAPPTPPTQQALSPA